MRAVVPKDASAASRKRGRPRKFHEPSRVVALTLPEGIIRGLRDVHPDLAWAIVTLFERRRPASVPPPRTDAELVAIADRQSLIVVRPRALAKVPGVRVVPLDRERAFLALETGRGIADLELAVIDRLGKLKAGTRQHRALSDLRSQLRKWRQSRTLRFHSHSIVVVEHVTDVDGKEKHATEAPRRSVAAESSDAPRPGVAPRISGRKRQLV